MKKLDKNTMIIFVLFVVLFWVVPCLGFDGNPLDNPLIAPASAQTGGIAPKVDEAPFYLIGPKDTLNIFVWRNADLGRSVAVRPDGRISIPLVEDLPVTGKTPTQLARDIEKQLGIYIKDPIVTVIVGGFLGPFEKQIRVVGEATKPKALPFYEGLTLLDLMISVGGITEFAAGNSAKIFRINEKGEQKEFDARIEDLIKDGDITANVDMLPGDILIIPESWF